VVNIAEAAAACDQQRHGGLAQLRGGHGQHGDRRHPATLDPNLSTSTKSVVDMNGGEASPGDTLRYTITLTESAGARRATFR
jgi:hypothetical protein